MTRGGEEGAEAITQHITGTKNTVMSPSMMEVFNGCRFTAEQPVIAAAACGFTSEPNSSLKFHGEAFGFFLNFFFGRPPSSLVWN